MGYELILQCGKGDIRAMAEESKIEQNFNAAYGVAGVVQGDQIINPPQTPQAEKPAESPNNLNRARTGAVNFVGREDAMVQMHHSYSNKKELRLPPSLREWQESARQN